MNFYYKVIYLFKLKLHSRSCNICCFFFYQLRWLLDNVPEVSEAASRGSLLFGTVDTWLIWNLTKERAHITDVTNASR